MILLMAAATVAANAAGNDVEVGRWKTQSDNGIVEIVRCGGVDLRKPCHVGHAAQQPRSPRQQNKDPNLRARRLQGLPIFNGFTRTKDAWTGGTIYDGQDGGTYNATVMLIDADHLKVKGCIVWPLCKSETWTRVD